MGHDPHLQARIFEYAKGLGEGSFPVLWSSNYVYGYGMPLFQFYGPLPYFLGSLFYLAGVDITTSVEFMMVFTSVMAISGMYFLLKAWLRDEAAALIGAAAYTLAPYRAVDLYVRAAMSETMAIGFLPWFFLGLFLIAQKKKGGVVLTALGFSAIALSHNIMTLLLGGVAGVVLIGLVLLYGKSFRERIQLLLFSGLALFLGAGISSFYLLPAFLEKGYTKIDTFILGSYYDFRQHFLYIRQLFEPWGSWEFGGSGWGPNDEMSFFLGYAQIGVTLAAVILSFSAARRFWVQKRLRALEISLFGVLGLFAISILLTLLKTQPIWELFPVLAYVQFPWRVLSFSIFFGSVLFGLVVALSAQRWKVQVCCLLFILLVGFNSRYFQSEKSLDYSKHWSDFDVLIQSEFSQLLYDFIPRQVDFFSPIGFYLYPNQLAQGLEVPAQRLIASSSSPVVSHKVWKNNSERKTFSVTLAQPSQLSLALSYFPRWTAAVNGEPVVTSADVRGLVHFAVPAGAQYIEVVFLDTPLRYFTKIASSISLMFLFWYGWRYDLPLNKIKKRKRASKE